MAELFENIKKLCLADGTSGDESDVTKLILSMLPQECDAKIDPLGNIIVNKKGAETPKNKVMLAAHQTDTSDLKKIVGVFSSARKTLYHAENKTQIPVYQLLSGCRVAAAHLP